MKMKSFVSTILFVLIYVGNASVDGQEFNYSQTILNPSGTGVDFFGATMAQSGNTLLIGAESEAVLGTNAANGGAAYVFDVTDGTLQFTFREPNPGTYHLFGRSVSISGTNAVIGTSVNRAYRFDTTTGVGVSLPSPIAPGQYFGDERSVSAFGSGAIVSARNDDSQAALSGRAYFYDSAGNLLGPINNPSSSPLGDFFGSSVAATDSRILVGAMGDDPGAGNAGAAFLFDAAGSLITTINNPHPSLNDRFGWNVAISEDYLLIADELNEVYLFDHSGTLLHRLSNPNPGGDGFGFDFAISGDDILIGAPQEDLFGNDAGAAYLFNATTGELMQTLSSPTAQAGDRFGQSVSISGDYLAIGAPGVGGYHGEVYLFARVVPEPSALVLFGLAIFGLYGHRSRKHKLTT